MNSAPNETDTDIAADVALTDDMVLGGRLRLFQPAKGHRAGTDAILLAAATPVTTGTVIDVGAGVGTVGLALARRHGTSRTILLERDRTLAELARRNVAANDLAERVSVAEADVLAPLLRRSAGVRNECADAVVTNPPFYAPGRGQDAADRLKRDAHVIDGTLDAWLRACCTLLRPGGTLVVIHRAAALDEILGALSGRTGAMRLRPIQAHVGDTATRILVTATKASRAPLEILPPLILHEPSGAFTAEVQALHEGHGSLCA